MPKEPVVLASEAISEEDHAVCVTNRTVELRLKDGAAKPAPGMEVFAWETDSGELVVHAAALGPSHLGSVCSREARQLLAGVDVWDRELRGIVVGLGNEAGSLRICFEMVVNRNP